MPRVTFWNRKKAFMEWEDYEEMITTMDLLSWQQTTRKQSLKNALATS